MTKLFEFFPLFSQLMLL